MLTFRRLIFPTLLYHPIHTWYFECSHLNVDISHVTLSPQIWNVETLKLWKLHLKFLLFVLAHSEPDTSNVDISHITLSTQMWNLETLKPSPQVFAVCLFPLNLTFRMLTFRMLTFPMLIFHETFLLSKTKCAVFKYEKFGNFKYENCVNCKCENCVNCKYEKCANFKYEQVSISNTKIRHFLKREMCHFQIRKCVCFKYENVSLSNTKNVSFSNTRMCHFQIRKRYRFQIRKMWSVCIFQYECYLFLQQTARHIWWSRKSIIWFEIKLEMLHTRTITVWKIIHAWICYLK